MLIKDVLTIDLKEDIKNVIDLEDSSESAIRSEIESYIVTEGLAREYVSFVTVFTSNIKETGVWLSGFYGSGKSYFGKMLGYMLSSRHIEGTPARDRIIQRFVGLEDESLTMNAISKLATVNSRVVFMDIAKQDTSKGFAYAFFKNFLKSLRLPENEHGFFLFTLMMEAGYRSVEDFIQDKAAKSWAELRTNRTAYIGVVKQIYADAGNSESDYTNRLTTIRREIDEFDASKLNQELKEYFKVVKDERVVFMFDEASEAIAQKKFTLLDLEGLSEALSALGGKVWTIAIAQEKLDDVINNSNVSKAQLTKVTDRFKTKVHLEATEVDVIIKTRLLKKKDGALSDLKAHYQKNSGRITDHSSLIGAGKTDSLDSYLTYYPFYQNQFGLLQNFLFGRSGLASTKVAARGMIITTHDILKHEIQNAELYKVATGWQIAKEAQPQPPVILVNRFDNAERILRENGIDISGRHLLETINFLAEAETTQTTLGNVVRSFIGAPEDFQTKQSIIQKALVTLVEHKILLENNGSYRITSDTEQRLLDEMKQFPVQTFKKKQQVINAYKSASFIKSLGRINDNNTGYDFYITTDNEDELTNPSLKQLKIKVKSLYSYGDDRNADVEQLKQQSQNDVDLIWLAPTNAGFKEIDSLLDEIERIKYLVEKYTDPNSEEGPIVRTFQSEQAIKENRLKELVEESLQGGTSIYLYNTAQLDKNNWESNINGLQRQVIQNVFSQRLSSQLSDALAEKIIKENNDARLHTFFTSQGADFQFYDAKGNFIGESLKPAERILFQIRNTFVDGATLEKELEKPPTGFSYGTVASTVAALMRGGKVMAKHNGTDLFSWKDAGVVAVFATAREFRRASFKAISRSLSSEDKNLIVTSLQELEFEEHVGKKVDWNTNDFDLVNAVREMARRFCDKVDDMERQNKDFSVLFGNLDQCKQLLSEFTGAVSEVNYIDRSVDYLARKEEYGKAVKEIGKAEKFTRNNLSKLRTWKSFADGVVDELSKAARVDANVNALVADFNALYKGEVVKNFGQLQAAIQKVKDAYFKLMDTAAKEMAERYGALKSEAEKLINEIDGLPKGLNDEAALKASSILQYAAHRTSAEVRIDFDIRDQSTRFTYSELLSFLDLHGTKRTEVQIIRSGLVRRAPEQPQPGTPEKPRTRTYTAQLPGKKVTVLDYRAWLQQELQKLAGASDSDEIEISNI